MWDQSEKNIPRYDPGVTLTTMEFQKHVRLNVTTAPVDQYFMASCLVSVEN